MENMRYILKRVLLAAVSLFVIVTLTYFLMNLMPGDPFMSEKATEENRAILIAKVCEEKFKNPYVKIPNFGTGVDAQEGWFGIAWWCWAILGVFTVLLVFLVVARKTFVSITVNRRLNRRSSVSLTRNYVRPRAALLTISIDRSQIAKKHNIVYYVVCAVRG
jgi:hypothetical protein